MIYFNSRTKGGSNTKYEGKIKQFISLLVTVVLMAGMFPISMMFASDAVFEPVFTVIIDESVIGDISVTLTNFKTRKRQERNL